MNNSAKIISLKEMKVLKDLSQVQIEILANQAIFQRVAKNTIIYDISSKMEYVYLIEKGSIKLGMLGSCGKSMTKEILYEQEIFGELIFSADLITKEFAESMTESCFYKIPIGAIQAMLLQNAAFAKVVMNIMAIKLKNLEERLQNFVFRKAKERIVDFIYRSGMRKGLKIGLEECLIDHGMSHKEISYLTDTSRQTVARIMNELKRENYIHYGSHKSSKILIRNINSLQNYRLVS